jgi:hypothetical protein
MYILYITNSIDETQKDYIYIYMVALQTKKTFRRDAHSWQIDNYIIYIYIYIHGVSIRFALFGTKEQVE